MFFNKFIIVFLLFFFSISAFGMDFSDDAGGMNFGGDEVHSTKKVKKSKKKTVKKKKNKKSKKKKIVKKAPKEDSGMTFGEEEKNVNDSEANKKKEDSGMTFGEETTTSKTENNTEESSAGMTFGEEDAGMVFGEEETGDEGKIIKQEEMNFNLSDIDKDTKVKDTKKEDKVKITKRTNSYVIKGVYFKLASGTTYLLSPKFSNGAELDKKSIFGFNTHLSLGYDINTSLSLDLYGEFIFNQAQIKGDSNILYSRDLNSRTLGLGLNFNVVNTERTNIHLNLHGGMLIIDPSLNIDGIKVSVGGLVGFEYYLLLKHFSTSIFVSSDYMTGYDTLSVSIAASLKYSF
jgi:hypothetical protein